MTVRNPRASALSRRLLVGASAAVLALTTFGCSTEGGPGSSPSTPAEPSQGATSAAPTNDGIYTVSMGAPGTQYYRNYNPFSPAEAKGSGISWFYEPLVRYEKLFSTTQPWLADSWEATPDQTEITFHLHPGVTWSDGEPFTSADVVYSMMLPKQFEGSNIVIPATGVKEATAVDDLTVKLVMEEPGLTNIQNFSSKNIYPKHIFEKQDFSTWLNEDPVGTSPFKLESLSPQQQTLSIRADYWNGSFPTVKQVNLAVATTSEAQLEQLIRGDLDQANIGVTDADENFVSKGPGNVYRVWPQGYATVLGLNNAKAPFDDVNARRAIRDAIDFKKVISLDNTGILVANASGVGTPWATWRAPELDHELAPDVDAAKQSLADGGWTVVDGNLTKDGKSYPINLITMPDYPSWPNYAAGMAQELKTNLGIEVKVTTITNDQYWDDLSQGNFDMAFDDGYCWHNAFEAFSCSHFSMDNTNLVPLGDKADMNTFRFDNAEATQIIKKYSSSFDQDELISASQSLQKIYVDQVPYIYWSEAGEATTLSGKSWTWTGLTDIPHYIPAVWGGPDEILFLKDQAPSGN